MFRFSIRDLFWLTLVVAVGLGWWLNWKSEKATKAELIRYSQRLRNSLVDARALADELWKKPLNGIFTYTEVDWSVLNESAP